MIKNNKCLVILLASGYETVPLILPQTQGPWLRREPRRATPAASPADHCGTPEKRYISV